jgi:hypothetical protein
MKHPIELFRAFDLNGAAARVHVANQKWWVNPHTGERIERNPFEILALVHSELSEALEGERKSKMDDHLPERKMAEVEMADAMIRLLDCAGAWGVKLSSFDRPYWVAENRGEAINNLHGNITQLGYVYRDGGSIGGWISISIHAIMSYCLRFEYDLLGAYEEKMAYNATRADHTLEARRAAGGKAF